MSGMEVCGEGQRTPSVVGEDGSGWCFVFVRLQGGTSNESGRRVQQDGWGTWTAKRQARRGSANQLPGARAGVVDGLRCRTRAVAWSAPDRYIKDGEQRLLARQPLFASRATSSLGSHGPWRDGAQRQHRRTPRCRMDGARGLGELDDTRPNCVPGPRLPDCHVLHRHWPVIQYSTIRKARRHTWGFFRPVTFRQPVLLAKQRTHAHPPCMMTHCWSCNQLALHVQSTARR